MNDEFKRKIEGKIILITGGTGSFGNSVIRSLLKSAPKKIIIFSRDEKKQFDMRNEYDNEILSFVIGDIRDRDSIRKVMGGVSYVFHAAALKQVPTCEFFPIEAVKTNILGAFNVIESAIEHNVERLVILSTDKAVYPINVMGMSKALMEKLMIAEAKSIKLAGRLNTILCGVRYGNVLYSRGSVVPQFIECIKSNKKLIITNPAMTRFLLPLQDAVSLVLFALTHGENGDMYVRKAPACTVEILAKAFCGIFNYKLGFEVVGNRAGEKMHETLVSSEELLRVVDLGEYFRIPSESQGLDYDKYLFQGDQEKIYKDIQPLTSSNTMQLDVDETSKLLLTLPEIQRDLLELKIKPD